MTDLEGLRALAEKALDPIAWTDPVQYDWPDAEGVGLWREADDLIAALRPTVVLALLDEITTLRAEVADRDRQILALGKACVTYIDALADRDARIEAVKLWADEMACLFAHWRGLDWIEARNASGQEVIELLSGPAVPVPQDNPEATREQIGGE
tara:strand:+ start:5662 stop:6123 length:462 start_codon:yes stop_codon:yes gene_type:complete